MSRTIPVLFVAGLLAAAAATSSSGAQAGAAVRGGVAPMGNGAMGGPALRGTATTAPMTGGAVRGGTASAIGNGAAAPGVATTTVAGRTVHAVVDGGVVIHTEGRQVARVDIPAHTLLVEPSRLLLDGSELTTLPRGSDIEIQMTGNLLTVRSGGTEILSQRLGVMP